MMFLLVDVSPQLITIVGDAPIIGANAYREARERRQPTHQLWAIDDFEEAQEMVARHNRIITGEEVVIMPPPEQRETYITDRIQYSGWDWSLVSAANKTLLLSYYQNEQWSDIMQLHNSLSLTDEIYCCNSFIPKIRANMDKAIADGIL